MVKIKLSDLSYEKVEKNQNKKVKVASEIILRTSLKEIPTKYWDITLQKLNFRFWLFFWITA